MLALDGGTWFRSTKILKSIWLSASPSQFYKLCTTSPQLLNPETPIAGGYTFICFPQQLSKGEHIHTFISQALSVLASWIAESRVSCMYTAECSLSVMCGGLKDHRGPTSPVRLLAYFVRMLRLYLKWHFPLLSILFLAVNISNGSGLPYLPLRTPFGH